MPIQVFGTSGELTTWCPKMAVKYVTRNPFRPLQPRLTDNLPSQSSLTYPGVQWDPVLIFPPTYVRYNFTGEEMQLPEGMYWDAVQKKIVGYGEGGVNVLVPDWIVDACIAYVGLRDNPVLWVKYDREASIMLDGIQYALPCLGAGKGTLPNGIQVRLEGHLPLARGVPVGQWWQYRKDVIIEAVTLHTKVTKI